MVFFHSSRQLARYVVCDHDSKFCYELFLLRIIAFMLDHRIVSLVDMDLRINFLNHLSLLLVLFENPSAGDMLRANYTILGYRLKLIVCYSVLSARFDEITNLSS